VAAGLLLDARPPPLLKRFENEGSPIAEAMLRQIALL
jgi:hypothetical protein